MFIANDCACRCGAWRRGGRGTGHRPGGALPQTQTVSTTRPPNNIQWLCAHRNSSIWHKRYVQKTMAQCWPLLNCKWCWSRVDVVFHVSTGSPRGRTLSHWAAWRRVVTINVSQEHVVHLFDVAGSTVWKAQIGRFLHVNWRCRRWMSDQPVLIQLEPVCEY